MNENIWVLVSQVENRNREKHFKSPVTQWEFQHHSNANVGKLKRLIHRITHNN